VLILNERLVLVKFLKIIPNCKFQVGKLGIIFYLYICPLFYEIIYGMIYTQTWGREVMLIFNFYLVTVMFSILTLMLIFYAINYNEKFYDKILRIMMNSDDNKDDYNKDSKLETIITSLVSVYFMIPIINIIASIALLTMLYGKNEK